MRRGLIIGFVAGMAFEAGKWLHIVYLAIILALLYFGHHPVKLGEF